jgi:hypothetical protein
VACRLGSAGGQQTPPRNRSQWTRMCRCDPYDRAVPQLSGDNEGQRPDYHRGRRRPEDPPESCPNCGREPGSRREAITLAQELAVVWLVAESGAGVSARRFCRACAPSASPGDVACDVCADGPVLSQDVIALTSENAVVRWLNTQGWRRSANQRGDGVLLCPRCAQFDVWPKSSHRDTGSG